MWPFTAATRRSRSDPEPYILLDESEYYVCPDEDAPEVPAPAARRVPGLAVAWLGALGAVLLLGVLSTPVRDGRPVLATPGYREVARHAAQLEAALREAGAWDAAMELALGGGAGDPWAVANRLRGYAEQAEARARELALRRPPQRVRVEHLALERWYADAGALMRELAEVVISPGGTERMATLRARWEQLRAVRQQLADAVARLRRAYPQGVIPW